jgi:hypothetical protein
MEIKILHHSSEESIARRIGDALSKSGISSQLSDTEQAPNGVHIEVKKVTKQQDNLTEPQSLLTSSFVDIDSTPGY